MSSGAKYSDRFKKEVKEKETSKEPVVSTKSFADFPSLGKSNVVERASPTTSPWAQTIKDSIAAAAAAAAAAEIKRKADDEANRVISSAAPRWAPTLRVKGREEHVQDDEETGYNATLYEEETGYNATLYEEGSRTPPYR